MSSHAVVHHCDKTADALIARWKADFPSDFAPNRPLWTAGAPRVLDVMGGIAECCGSLTLGYPLAAGATVGVQPREDGHVCIVRLQREPSRSTNETPSAHRVCLSTDRMRASNGRPAYGDRLAESLCPGELRWAFPVAAAILEVLSADGDASLADGLTVVVDNDSAWQDEPSVTCTLVTAAILATAAAGGQSLAAEQLACLTRRVLHRVHENVHGVAASACAAFGEPNALLKMNCQPFEALGSLPLPAGITLCGVDCGGASPESNAKYHRARVAALMGKTIIERVLTESDSRGVPWGGYLAQISVNDYVESLRDQLPTRLNGQIYLDRFGELGDPFSAIEPELDYRVRSRTEHHIYENARVHQFAQRLAMASRTNGADALLAAGELMQASHWSYGQRCGLGCIPIEAVVSRLRRCEPDRGIHGARISGRGAGGMVAVLLNDSDAARAALGECVSAVEARVGRELPILDGSSAGAFHRGVRRAG